MNFINLGFLNVLDLMRSYDSRSAITQFLIYNNFTTSFVRQSNTR